MNSIQAMPHGGDLNIDVQTAGTKVVCRIEDSGTGVSPELLPRLFEPLFTTKIGGHGLGLALTYQFVRSNGGEIHAECPPDSGLIITMTFPAFHAAEAELLCT
jgi:two-component system NtrC family sensor kinase